MAKITVADLLKSGELTLLTREDSLEREIGGVFSCDLLSFVMGRAPADCAWVTVMGNVNAVAVAVLADVSCIVLSEGAALDSMARERAEEQGVAVLSSAKPIFETGLLIHNQLHL